MNRPPLLVCGAVVLAAGVAALAYRSLGRPRSASAPDGLAARASDDHPDDEVARLRAELALLRAQLVRLEQRNAAAPVPAASSASPAATERRSPLDPEARAQGQRRRREYIAGMESAYRNEVIDPQWSSRATEVLQAALKAEDVGLTARQLECRSHICRLEIPDDGTDKLSQALPLLALELGDTLPKMTTDHVVDASGTATMVVYFRRRIEAP